MQSEVEKEESQNGKKNEIKERMYECLAKYLVKLAQVVCKGSAC